MKKKINKFFYIITDYKKRFLNSIILYVSSSFLDVLVLAMLPVLISTFFGKSSLIEFGVFKIELQNQNGIIIVGVIILFLTYLKGFFNYKSILNIIRLSSELQRINRKKIFSFYKKVYINQISKNNLEKYLNYTAYVVGVFSENVLFKLITVISEFLIIIIICLYLLTVEPFVLFGLALFFLILFSSYFFYVRKFILIAGKKQSLAMQKLAEIINSVFKGFKEIKVLKLDKYFDNKFNLSNDEFNKYNINYQKIIFLPKYLIEVVMITFVILLFFAVKIFSEKTLVSNIELLGVFIFAAFRIAPMAYNIFSSVSQIFSSWYSVDQLSSEFRKISLNKKERNKDDDLHSSHIQNIKKINTLKLKNIFFKYNKNNKNSVLKKINLNLSFGSCIGIKGESGSGKTTLINVILGLLKPDKGKVIINEQYDVNYTNFNKKISYTPQDIFLIKGSILDNITLGDNFKKNKIDKLIESAKNAQILSFLKKTSKKKILETLKQTDVEKLSGGQLQRVAIARTLYFEKEICVFDEFTSALDLQAEDKIVNHLNAIKKDKIIIIVSHRMNAMKYCDKIYELKNGQLI